MIHRWWLEPVLLLVYGAGLMTVWRGGSRGRAVKGAGFILMGAAGFVRWKPDSLALVVLVPAVLLVAVGLLIIRDEDKAREILAGAREAERNSLTR